ncbi:MAG: hypothetical protein HZB99_03045 [Candidatus Harrisonbacteria bacterium]|nr:hypothetical protein [Candidatus Harrisonbacteria bacterium]
MMLSLGTMVYLAVRALPRVPDTDSIAEPLKENYIDRLIKRLPLEKADTLASSLLEKLLRKSKIVILKLDNFLTKHLQNLRSPQGADKTDRPNIFEKKEDNLPQ